MPYVFGPAVRGAAALLFAVLLVPSLLAQRATQAALDAGQPGHERLAGEVKGQLPFPIRYYRGLSGTYAELRYNHYHYGIDVRAGVGTPIYAVADGHVARIRVSHRGYGKAIYIDHPNGTTTVYAHMSKFYPKVEEYIYSLQRRSKLYDQEIYLDPGVFAVHAGQLIGYTGNSGSSAGPHLHYEVRDRAEFILNPLAWHRHTIDDSQPPYVVRAALQPLEAESRVAGRFEKLVFTPSQQGSDYYHNPVVKVRGPIGLEYTGYDRMEQSTQYNGIYGARLWLDDTLVWEYRADRFGFHHSTSINQHIDYRYLRRSRGFLTKCYLDENNRTPMYRNMRNRGYVELQDDAVHRLRLQLYDFHGNETALYVNIQRDTRSTNLSASSTVEPSYELRRDVLLIRSALPEGVERAIDVLYKDGSRERIVPSYSESDGSAVSLLALRPGKLPVRAEGPLLPKPLLFDLQGILTPYSSVTVRQGSLEATFPTGCVFTVQAINLSSRAVGGTHVLSRVYDLGDAREPLLSNFELRLQVEDQAKAKNYRPQQILMAEYSGSGRYSRVGGSDYTGGGYTAQPRSFGSFCLVADVQPPTLRYNNLKPGGRLPRGRTLHFTVDDDIAGIRPESVYVELDGNWVLAEYDSYHRQLSIPFKEGFPAPGRHELSIRLTDYADNSKTHRFSFVAGG